MKNKILYVYHLDATNPRIQSGRPYAIYTQFLKDPTVELHFVNLSNFSAFRIGQFLCKSLYFLRLTNTSSVRSKFLLFISSAIISRHLKKGYDYIFSPTSLWWISEKRRKSYSVKSICCIDIHLHGYIDLYNYPKRSITSDLNAESISLSNFDIIIFPSKYAKQNLIKNSMHGAAANAHVIPFGANLPLIYNDLENPTSGVFRQEGKLEFLNFLVISSDWQRKGGDFISHLLNRLSMSFSINLFVIGTGFIRKQLSDIINVYHFKSLNKSIPEQAFTFDKILRSCDFFLMPSKGEAYGMSVCEAIAYGVIPIISSSGGLSQFRDNLHFLPVFNSLKDIENIENFIFSFIQKDLKERVALRSELINLYKSNYNWDVFYERFSEIAFGLI